MYRNAAYSILFHIVLVVAGYVGLPSFTDIEHSQDVPISVEIINVSDETNLPTKPKEDPKPEVAKAEPKPKPKPPAPPPAPKGAVEQPPEPEPEPEPEVEKVAVVVPEPKPKKEAKPKPEPKPEPKKTAAKKKRAPTPIPPRRPAPPDQFASVLKTLEDLKTAPRQEKKDEKPEPSFADMMKDALASDTPRTDIGPELTISEIDQIKRQIAPCWNLPAGAKDVHEMVISVRLAMNPDGTVQQVKVLGNALNHSDPFFRTMAETAQRATLDRRCQPFRLPLDKYQRWKTMKLTFEPGKMFGL